MNVNPSTVHNLFNTKKTGAVGACVPDSVFSASKLEAARAGVPEKMDTVTISSQANQQREMGKIVKSVMKDIERYDEAARIDEIKQAVARNEYRIPTDALANALLERSAGL